jgi:hypothetical protein
MKGGSLPLPMFFLWSKTEFPQNSSIPVRIIPLLRVKNKINMWGVSHYLLLTHILFMYASPNEYL